MVTGMSRFEDHGCGVLVKKIYPQHAEASRAANGVLDSMDRNATL
jgi:hypothetical protein